MAGERRTQRVTASGLKGGAAIPRLEVEGAPDSGVPPVSLWRKRKKGRAVLGRRGKQARPARAASTRTGKGRCPGASRAKRRVGPVVKRGEGRGRRFSLCFFYF
jgi:hypothetical protein